MRKKRKPKFLPFEDAREIARDKFFRVVDEYKQWVRSKGRALGMPSDPSTHYDEWTGWSDWLGRSYSGRRIQRSIKHRTPALWDEQIKGLLKSKECRAPRVNKVLDTLKNEMTSKGVSNSDLAILSGCALVYVNDIFSGKRQLSKDLARRFKNALKSV